MLIKKKLLLTRGHHIFLKELKLVWTSGPVQQILMKVPGGHFGFATQTSSARRPVVVYSFRLLFSSEVAAGSVLRQMPFLMRPALKPATSG